MTYVMWALFAVLLVLVVAAIAAAASVLVWWAGWTRRSKQTPSAPRSKALVAAPVEPQAGPFLVYFSGIGDISDEFQTRYEDDLLAAIATSVPGLVVVDDVFGFSVDNLSMTSQRRLGWFWNWVNSVRMQKGSPIKLLGKLIDMRNMLQFAVSADQRYGPMYNYGVAEMTLQGLVRHGYVLGSGAPIALLGYSGGGQIALATAGYIHATLRAPVQVISMGGLMNSNPSLKQITRLTHLYGSADWLQRLPDWIFPARWPLFRQSDWNQAVAAGKITRIRIGPMGHTGRKSYLDATTHDADGRSYQQLTADAVAALLTDVPPPARRMDQRPGGTGHVVSL
jgi:hypothetical protein